MLGLSGGTKVKIKKKKKKGKKGALGKCWAMFLFVSVLGLSLALWDSGHSADLVRLMDLQLS